MKAKKLLIVTGVIFMAFVGTTGVYSVTHKPSLTPQSAVPATPPNVPELVADVNKERTKAGLQPLAENPLLEQSSQNHCNDMLATNTYAHIQPNGKKPLDYILEIYGKGKAFINAENNAYGFVDSQSAVNGWMNSPGHRANILNATFTQVGYAICKGANYTAPANGLSDGYLIVQQFTSTPVAN